MRPAFAATPARAAITLPNATRAVCATRPTPFFASSAFGSPIAAARMPTPAGAPAGAPNGAASVRMDVTVVVNDGEPIESALRRFKKEVTKSGHLYELRRRRYFETNTEKRLRKAASAKRKMRMARNMKRRPMKKPNLGKTEENSEAAPNAAEAAAPAPAAAIAAAPEAAASGSVVA